MPCDVPDPPESRGERGRARLDGDREVVVVEQGEHASVGSGVAEPRQGALDGSTPSMVNNGRLLLQTSVSLRIPLYGSCNLAYISCKMDYMCPL